MLQLEALYIYLFYLIFKFPLDHNFLSYLRNFLYFYIQLFNNLVT